MPSPSATDAEFIRKDAVSLYQSGDSIGAVKMAERSVQVAEATLGRDHLVVAATLSTLGTLLFDLQRYDEGAASFARSLDIQERASSTNDSALISDLNNLALLYRAQGRYVEAKVLLERALAIDEKMPGRANPGAGRTINNLALVYHSERNYDEADKLYRRALAIRESTPKTQPRDVAESLNNLAELCSERGDYSQAESLYVRSLEMHRHATTLENFSLCMSKRGRGDEGEAPLKEALDLRTRDLGPDHPAALRCASLLACYYDGRQMHKEAERLRKHVASYQADSPRTPIGSLKAQAVRILSALSKLPRWRTMKRKDATSPNVRALVAHAEIDDSDALA